VEKHDLLRYEKRSTIYTSNKGFTDSDKILRDQVMASAVLDRILHHCAVINIPGESYRLREREHNSLSIEKRGEKNERKNIWSGSLLHR